MSERNCVVVGRYAAAPEAILCVQRSDHDHVSAAQVIDLRVVLVIALRYQRRFYGRARALWRWLLNNPHARRAGMAASIKKWHHANSTCRY